jgi:hypothetical protein
MTLGGLVEMKLVLIIAGGSLVVIYRGACTYVLPCSSWNYDSWKFGMELCSTSSPCSQLLINVGFLLTPNHQMHQNQETVILPLYVLSVCCKAGPWWTTVSSRKKVKDQRTGPRSRSYSTRTRWD